jgi:hypothetical protein
MKKKYTRFVLKVSVWATLPDSNECHLVKSDEVESSGYNFQLPPLSLFSDGVKLHVTTEPIAIRKYKQSKREKNMIEIEEEIVLEE